MTKPDQSETKPDDSGFVMPKARGQVGEAIRAGLWNESTPEWTLMVRLYKKAKLASIRA